MKLASYSLRHLENKVISLLQEGYVVEKPIYVDWKACYAAKLRLPTRTEKERWKTTQGTMDLNQYIKLMISPPREE